MDVLNDLFASYKQKITNKLKKWQMKNFDIEYKEVIKQLKNGIPIYKTLKRLNVCRADFYNYLSPKQRSELDLNRIATKKQSYKHHNCNAQYTKVFSVDYLYNDEEM